jgi:hypothetical protein
MAGYPRSPGRRPGLSLRSPRAWTRAPESAGRDPAEIRRLCNVAGAITDGPAGGLLQGPPEHWVETLTGFSAGLGFDTFVFWPTGDPRDQLERFAAEVVPALR